MDWLASLRAGRAGAIGRRGIFVEKPVPADAEAAQAGFYRSGFQPHFNFLY